MTKFSTITDPLKGSLPPGNSSPGLLFGSTDIGVYFGLYWNTATQSQTLFLYKNGGYTLLNSPFTIANSSAASSWIHEVNSSGEVAAGFFGTVNSIPVNHGLMYSNSEYTQIDHPNASTSAVFTTPTPTGTWSYSGTIISGINDAGKTVGNYVDAAGKSRGFLYNDYNFTTIDNPLGLGKIALFDINNKDQIIGSYLDGNNNSHAFIYSNGSFQELNNNLSIHGVQLQHINDSGQIIGAYTDANNKQIGFLYNAGKYDTIPLPLDASGYLGSTINNKGQIAGSYYTGDISNGTAVFHNFEIQSYNISSVVKSAAADNVYLLYQASFARLPDEAGFNYWSGQAVAKNITSLQLADAFMNSPEFTSVFGNSSNNADYVTKLYSNVLGRQPDIAGAHYWTEQLNSGAKARDVVLVGFAEGTENVTNTAQQMNNGYWIL